MNLVTDRWLPVTDRNNRLCYISLNQLFGEPDEWLDLVLRPHERVSVMRFLICIVQAALGGGPSEDSWNDYIDETPQKCLNYLKSDERKRCFDLYVDEIPEDDKTPFLQIAELEPFNKEPTPTTKLKFSLATGNNSTLFDHSGLNIDREESKRLLDNSDLVVSMLSFNNFSLAGLYPQAKWKDKITSKSGVKDAPCASMLHCFVRKDTVIETVHANILTKEQIIERYGENVGVPVWDHFPSSPSDHDAIKNATQTYIGRLVPLSRWLKILPDRKTMLMGEGFVYPVYPDFTEATAIEVISTFRAKQERRILGSKNTTPWRELFAMTTKRISDKKDIGGPPAVENQSKFKSYDLHVLALKRDNQSILDTVESVLHVPDYFSQSEECRESYKDGVKKSEIKSYKLGESIQTYLSFLMPDMVEIVDKGIRGEKLKKKESDKYQFIKERVKSKYLTHYWTLIEKDRHLLMHYISVLGTERDEEREEAQKAWLSAINRAARETYRTLCSQESPREVRAYVVGWQLLNS
ncbi:MAG TPA: type I-E CRISPR-associated protein Cse1/CasA [Deltaproteobacteria bacterium]|nr:type I-E CRISPR-associated protein Cse1/CasA [Deltaproteobacteria bacterium]